MLHLFSDLSIHTLLFLGLALIFVLFYEAINGFHDTANAVATVIYTRALREKLAVALAGVFNFLGVLLGGLSVAYAIVHLLPTDLLLNVSSAHGLAMIFSILLAAIIWNFGTWYLGLPASSSHTLIGSIIGVALTNAILTNGSLIEAININATIKIFISLITSPIVGLIVAGAIMYLLKRFWNKTKKQRRIHMTPAEREKIDGKRKPPFWIRTLLILSAIGVSFSHGANDGQKGIGLLMLVLIAIAPASFLINMHAEPYEIARTYDALNHLEHFYQKNTTLLTQLPQIKEGKLVPNAVEDEKLAADSHDETYHCHPLNTIGTISRLKTILTDVKNYDELSPEKRELTRRWLLCISDTTSKIAKLPSVSKDDELILNKYHKDLLVTVEYAPIWIIIAVALALGIGTMVGWRRVAVTIGEKIGKKGMTYAQGLAAQITSACSISVASYTGMPVSTTQVLSSAIAGTMIVSGGGVQKKTIKNLALAWVLTFPASICISGVLFWIAIHIIN